MFVNIKIMLIAKYFCVFLFILPVCCSLTFSKRPNIVVVITDDQDSTLGGITPLTKLDSLVTKKGTTFVNSFVASPICCPSRCSLLTGLYPHNHLTTNNSLQGGCSSHSWQAKYEPLTFAAVLHKSANYTTFYAGKYLNEYGHASSGGPEHVPPGWSEWRGLVGNSRYYNFTLSHNGVPNKYHNGEYLTDVIRDLAVEFIEQRSKEAQQPLLMVLSPPAPHAPFEPAPRHKDAFPGLQALRTPNFNILPENDKHWLVQMTHSPLPNETLPKLDEIFRARWQTLLAVDEMMEKVVDSLKKADMLNNTYIIFTSDNGYHIGQFSQPFDKRQPYETDIRVPFVIKGPGVDQDAIKLNPIMNIDIAPTILKLAGIADPPVMDGLPLPLFHRSEAVSIATNEVWTEEMYERQMLIEYSGEGSHSVSTECPWGGDTNLYMCLPEYMCKCQDSKNNSYSCVRHMHPAIDYLFCSFKDSQELEEAYDLREDPFEMNNKVNEMLPAIKNKYRTVLSDLQKCRGLACNYYLYF